MKREEHAEIPLHLVETPGVPPGSFHTDMLRHRLEELPGEQRAFVLEQILALRRAARDWR